MCQVGPFGGQLTDVWNAVTGPKRIANGYLTTARRSTADAELTEERIKVMTAIRCLSVPFSRIYAKKHVRNGKRKVATKFSE